MAALFNPEYLWLWTLVLALALYFPTQRLIWVLAMRRANRKYGMPDDVLRDKLRKRTMATAALLCFVFAFFYTGFLFKG